MHTSWPDIGSMHPSPRHSLVELKHLERTHWELVTKSWAPKSNTTMVYSPAPSLLVPNQPLMTQSSSRIQPRLNIPSPPKCSLSFYSRLLHTFSTSGTSFPFPILSSFSYLLPFFKQPEERGHGPNVQGMCGHSHDVVQKPSDFSKQHCREVKTRKGYRSQGSRLTEQLWAEPGVCILSSGSALLRCGAEAPYCALSGPQEEGDGAYLGSTVP